MNINIFIGVAIATEGALVAIAKQFARKQGAPAKAQHGGMSQFASLHYSAMSTAQAPALKQRQSLMRVCHQT